MKRDTTILILCGLFMLADVLCLQETIRFRQYFDGAFFFVTLFCQAVSAIIILWLFYAVARKKFFRRKIFRANSVVFQPLRRALLSILTLKFVRR